MYNNYYAINTYDDRYLAHHGILGQKWGIRRYQNEDGTLTEAGKKRYRAYEFNDMYLDSQKLREDRLAKVLVSTGAIVPTITLGPVAALGVISVPTLLASIGAGVGLGAFSALSNKGMNFVLQKMNDSRRNNFTRKLEKDRIKNGVQ